MHILGRCYLSLGRDAEALEHASSGRWTATAPRATGNGRRPPWKSLGTAQSRAGLAAEARTGSWAQAAAIFDDLGDSAAGGRGPA